MRLPLISRLAFVLFLVVPAITWAQTETVQNPGFETGQPKDSPPGWLVPPAVAQAGYRVEISTDNPQERKQCLAISRVTDTGQGFGNVMQTIDAKPFRGKRIRFRAAVRYVGNAGVGQAQLWLRVDRPGGAMGFFNNMGDRPVRSSTWAFYEIAGKVDDDAERINLGMLVVGSGTGYLDAVTLTTGSPVPDLPIEKPRALTPRGLENLVAYTKLLGYIRHFHPSDAVEKADWDHWAVAGVKAVEDAQTPAELADRLQAFFLPIAPTVHVYATTQKPVIRVSLPVGTGVVSWEHTGFGTPGADPRSAYHSRRVFTKGELAPPFQADLGGGVVCVVPISLPANNGEALPKTAEPVIPKGTRIELTGDDRGTRLAAVALGWNVFEHFYSYFDVVKTDWDATLREALTSAATDKDERAFLDTLRRMVASTHDGHGNVQHQSDQLYALPPLYADWVEGKFVVLQTGPDVSNVRPGDLIIKIDGTSVEERWKQLEPLLPGATEQWRRSRARVDLLRGAYGSSVSMEIQRGSLAPFTVNFKRGAGATVFEKRPKAIEELKPGIWYVDLDSSRAKLDAYTNAIHDLTAAQGVIFDMRGYPNNVAMDVIRRAAKSPITSANWNVPVITQPDHKGMQFTTSHWPDMPPLVPGFRGKVIFLTDGRAISYAESIMGIVENYKLGEIIGEPTAGTNGDIDPFFLPGGYRVIFTGMKVTKHDGSVHHGVGIQPTIVVHRTIAGVTAGKDEQLERAIEVIQGR